MTFVLSFRGCTMFDNRFTCITAGGAVPAAAQLVSSSYHAAYSSPTSPPPSKDENIQRSRKWYNGLLSLTIHSWWVCWEFCFSCVNTALEIGMFGTWMRGKIVEKRKNTYNDVFYFVWLKLKWKIDRKKFIVLLFCIHRVLAFGCNKITNRWQFCYFWNINNHFYFYLVIIYSLVQ